MICAGIWHPFGSALETVETAAEDSRGRTRRHYSNPDLHVLGTCSLQSRWL